MGLARNDIYRRCVLQMRIIAGTAKGMTLFSVKGDGTRPTTDFVKENLFNIIRDDLRGEDFLDLFTGTGAVGIEALSRGARAACFVDISPKSLAVVKRNLEKAGFGARALVVKGDASRAVNKLAGRKFKLIFLDPPYFVDLAEKSLGMIVQQDILARDGYIVLEMSKEEAVPMVGGLVVLREKEYSGTRLVFYGLGHERTEHNDCSVSGQL